MEELAWSTWLEYRMVVKSDHQHLPPHSGEMTRVLGQSRDTWHVMWAMIESNITTLSLVRPVLIDWEWRRVARLHAGQKYLHHQNTFTTQIIFTRLSAKYFLSNRNFFCPLFYLLSRKMLKLENFLLCVSKLDCSDFSSFISWYSRLCLTSSKRSKREQTFNIKCNVE